MPGDSDESTVVPATPAHPPVQTKDPEASSSAAVLSDYTTACLADWNQVAARVNSGRVLWEALANTLARLGELERDHASALTSLANGIFIPPSESEGIQSAVGVIKEHLSHSAEISNQFANALKSDILGSDLSGYLARHAANFRATEIEYYRNERRRSAAEADYARSSLQSLDSAKLALHSIVVNQKAPILQKASTASQALRTSTEALNAESDFSVEHKAFITTQMAFQQSRERSSRALEDMDRKRVACMKDMLHKVIVHLTAMNQSLRFDIDKAIKIVPALNTEAELRAFAEKVMSSKLASAAGDTVEESEYCLVDERPRGVEDVSVIPMWSSREARAGADKELLSRHDELKEGSEPNKESIFGLLRKNPIVENIVKHGPFPFVAHSPSPSKEADSAVETVPSLASIMASTVKLGAEDIEDNIQSSLCIDSFLQAVWSSDKESIESWLLKTASAQEDNSLETCLNTCADMIADSPGIRTAFCSTYLNASLSEGQAPLYLKSRDAFCLMSFMSSRLVAAIELNADYWNGRNLMIAIFHTFFNGLLTCDPRDYTVTWKIENAKWECDPTFPQEAQDDILPYNQKVSGAPNPSRVVRWDLSRSLYRLSLWNKIPFWEDSFTMTLSEARQLELLKIAWNQNGLPEDHIKELENNYKKKNIGPLVLNNYGNYMLNFGIGSPQICDMIQKVCNLHGVRRFDVMSSSFTSSMNVDGSGRGSRGGDHL